MSVFDWLGIGNGTSTPDEHQSGSQAVRDIKERLESLPPERAQWIAAFAMVLARAARADLEISSDEMRVMEEVVREYGELPPDQATLVVEMASHRNQLLGATEDYLATREFNRVAGEGDRERLLNCLFAICAADDSISVEEEEEVRQVATELGLEHKDYISARSAYRDKREVLRGLRPRPQR